MQDDKRPQVMELSHILYRRNEIEVRRRKAKSKVSYYEEVKRLIKHYRVSVARVSSLARQIRVSANTAPGILDLRYSLDSAKKEVASYNTGKMKPFKWLDKASDLNKRILKYRAEYMRARYDTARLTCQTRKRVARLISELKANINYQSGTAFVESLSLFGKTEQILAKDFESMFREVEANKAIEKALRIK